MVEINDQSGIGKIPRRDVLKLIGFAVGSHAANTVMAKETMHEAELLLTGEFGTPLAQWRPLYEIHPKHEDVFSPDNLPPNLDIVSLEGITFTTYAENDSTVQESVYTMNPDSLFLGHLEGYDTPNSVPQKAFPLQTLDHMKKHAIKAGFGDMAYIPDMVTYDPDEELKTRKNIGAALMVGGVATGAAGTARSRSLTRRNFLQTGGVVGFGVGLAAFAPPALRKPMHEAVMASYDHGKIAQRIVGRLNTIHKDLLPEYLNALFRELMQANKLMTIAQSLSDTKAAKPYIGYNWHLGHSGIEDWLRLGPELTRRCISLYPESVLRQVIKVNLDDPRCLWAMRVAAVPKSLTVNSITHSNGLIITSSRYDPKEKSFDKVFEDTSLKDELSKRLNLEAGS
ncbi:MAG: hypothetical protein AAB800_03570 [Patescibacteria group bacterium]